MKFHNHPQYVSSPLKCVDTIPIILNTKNKGEILLDYFKYQYVINLEKGLVLTSNHLYLMISAAGYYHF